MDDNTELVFPAERIPTLVVAVATLALALWVVTLRPHDRVHRALFLFLFIRSFAYGLLAVDPSATSLAARYAGYYFLLLPFAALAFGRAFHLRYQVKKREGEPRFDWLYTSLWVLAAAALTWFFFDKEGVLPGTNLGVLSAVASLSYLAYAILGLLFARQFLDAPLGSHRQAMLLLAIGFMVDAAFRSFRILPQFIFSPPDGYVQANLLSLLVFIGVWIILLETSIHMAVRSRGTRLHQGVTSYQVTVGLAAASGALLYVLFRTTNRTFWAPVQFFVEGFWLITLVGVIAYGIMRCRMFDIELQAKRLVRGGTVAAPFAFVFFVMGESMEGWALDTFGVNGYWLGLVAAGIISLGLFPLQRMARRVADTLFPGVDGSEQYQEHRRQQLYKAAVEDAVDDKVITDRERLMLNEIQNRLNLSAREAKGLEKAVMSSVMAVMAR